MTKFKVGDRVRRTKEAMKREDYCNDCAPNKVPAICEVIKIFEKDRVNVRCPNGREESVSNNRIELVNPKSLKAPTHLVIWDEEDKDPHKFFTDEKKVKDFMKELSEKSDVMQESVILVTIKSVEKVSITKIVRLKGYKI